MRRWGRIHVRVPVCSCCVRCPGLTHRGPTTAVDVVLSSRIDMQNFVPTSYNAHLRRGSMWQPIDQPNAPQGIDFLAEHAFELGRANMALNTRQWLCAHGDDAVPESAGACPVTDQITMVQLVSAVAGKYDTWALLEVEEKKPFGKHQMRLRYHGHAMDTDETWGIHDVIIARRLLKYLENKYNDTLFAGETTLADVEHGL